MFIFPQPPYSLGATQHFSSREWRLGRESFARSQNYFSTENYFPPFVCFCFGFRVTLNIKIAMYQFSRETLICHQTNAIITDRVILPRTQGEGKHRIYSRLPVTCDLKTPPKKKQQWYITWQKVDLSKHKKKRKIIRIILHWRHFFEHHLGRECIWSGKHCESKQDLWFTPFTHVYSYLPVFCTIALPPHHPSTNTSHSGPQGQPSEFFVWVPQTTRALISVEATPV